MNSRIVVGNNVLNGFDDGGAAVSKRAAPAKSKKNSKMNQNSIILIDSSDGERILFQEHKLRRSTEQQNQNLLLTSLILDGCGHYHGTQPRLERVATIPEQGKSTEVKTK
jgi:hypothetical protein